MSNTPTLIARPGDLTPGPSLSLPRPARLPLLDPPPGTTLITWRHDDRAEFIRTDELAEYLTRERGRGWSYGADAAGFEDFTVRDAEGDVLADLEQY